MIWQCIQMKRNQCRPLEDFADFDKLHFESLKTVDEEEINIHHPLQNVDQSDKFFVVWDSTEVKLGLVHWVRYWRQEN